jgi:hypothetical protein
MLVLHFLFVHNPNSSVPSGFRRLYSSLYFNTDSNIVLSPQNSRTTELIHIFALKSSFDRLLLLVAYIENFAFSPPEMCLKFVI